MKKIFTGYKTILILTAVVMLVLFAVSRWNSPTDRHDSSVSSEKPEIVTGIEVKEIHYETIKNKLSLSAVTQPAEKVEVIPEASGKISQLYVAEGNFVKKGQLLVQIESDPLMIVSLENAEKSLKNTKTLQKQLKKDAKDTSAYKATKKQAEFSIDTAEGLVDYYQSQFDKYSVRSSASGTISDLSVDVGDKATTTSSIATIVNDSSIKIESAVSALDIDKISVGQKADITLSIYPGEIFSGIIVYVSSVADTTDKKFPVRIKMDEKDSVVKAGMIAHIEIVIGERNGVFLIPITAIFSENGDKKAYVVNGDSEIEIRTIQAESVDNETSQVTEGLIEGDRVVIYGNYDLHEGDRVDIRD